MPTNLVVRCKVCDRSAPPAVVEAFREQLRDVAAGGALEADNWLGRVGPSRWDLTTVYACPEHRVASGLLR